MMNKPIHWHEYFLGMAEYVSTKSKDTTKMGCVIVGPNHEIRTTGYNGFCRGIDDSVELRHDRPEKYYWAEHAERNAIYNAARNGIPLEGTTAYISANVPPCADCTRALIQSGIVQIITRPMTNDNPKWQDSFKRSREMIAEARIDFGIYYGDNYE
jgi:dCMP deaminase